MKVAIGGAVSRNVNTCSKKGNRKASERTPFHLWFQVLRCLQVDLLPYRVTLPLHCHPLLSRPDWEA
jgi:hypothetical protein